MGFSRHSQWAASCWSQDIQLDSSSQELPEVTFNQAGALPFLSLPFLSDNGDVMISGLQHTMAAIKTSLCILSRYTAFTTKHIPFSWCAHQFIPGENVEFSGLCSDCGFRQSGPFQCIWWDFSIARFPSGNPKLSLSNPHSLTTAASSPRVIPPTHWTAVTLPTLLPVIGENWHHPESVWIITC